MNYDFDKKIVRTFAAVLAGGAGLRLGLFGFAGRQTLASEHDTGVEPALTGMGIFPTFRAASAGGRTPPGEAA